MWFSASPMNRNSRPNNAPTAMPGSRVPSLKAARPSRQSTRAPSTRAAPPERMASCRIEGTSSRVSLIATCWKPQQMQRTNIRPQANQSRGRREGFIVQLSRQKVRQRRQCLAGSVRRRLAFKR
ncbi:hypothetical protein D3C81_1583390 [compost metagenome]